MIPVIYLLSVTKSVEMSWRPPYYVWYLVNKEQEKIVDYV
jgi:hypothetical protein